MVSKIPLLKEVSENYRTPFYLSWLGFFHAKNIEILQQIMGKKLDLSKKITSNF